MTAYEKAVKELRKSQRRDREHLKLNKELLNIAEEYAEKFSSVHEWTEKDRFSIARFESRIWRCAKLELYLATEDRADCVNSIIDAMIKHPKLEMKDHPPKELEDTSTAHWEFRPKDDTSYYPYLSVSVHYDRSNSCKLVPTGKFRERREIMKMVCS